MNTILLVEDVEIDRQALATLLTRRGAVVQSAASFKAAKAIADDGKQIDVALVDLKLPDGNGGDFIEYLRERHSESIIIVLTGFTDVSCLDKFGDVKVIHKPITNEHLAYLYEICRLERLEKSK